MGTEKRDGEMTFKKITNNDIYDMLLSLKDDLGNMAQRVKSLEKETDKIDKRVTWVVGVILLLSMKFLATIAWVISKGGLFR